MGHKWVDVKWDDIKPGDEFRWKSEHEKSEGLTAAFRVSQNTIVAFNHMGVTRVENWKWAKFQRLEEEDGS